MIDKVMNDYSLKKRLFQLLDLPISVAKRFRSDRLTRHAAALSYSSLLALAPMMAIGLSVLTIFSSTEQLSSPLEDFFFQFLLPAASEDIRLYIDQFAGQAGKLSLIGLGLFLLTALLLLFHIEESFNDIWRVEQGRNIAGRLTVYWALVSLGPLLMGASLTISTYLLGLKVAVGGEIVGQVQSMGLVLLPFLFQLLAFMLLYLVMPNVRVSLKHALCGALVASILFELTKKGFAYYVLNFKSYEIVYGALSTLPIFLIWIYLSWVVALVGAEVVAVLQERKLLE